MQPTSRLFAPMLFITSTLCAPVFHSSGLSSKITSRQEKDLGFFDYLQPELDFDQFGSTNDNYDSLGIEENDLSRTLPGRKRLRPQFANSPIYYIRLPPQPYMFVPGLGYMSQPPPNPMSQFLNVPVNFVSNGKPNGIYQWSGGIEIPTAAPTPAPTTPKPKPKPVKKPMKPDSTIHRLPGTFNFNGRPEDIFILRDSYNSLYGDVLQNLYP